MICRFWNCRFIFLYFQSLSFNSWQNSPDCGTLHHLTHILDNQIVIISQKQEAAQAAGEAAGSPSGKKSGA
jgi:hypothetical protein